MESEAEYLSKTYGLSPIKGLEGPFKFRDGRILYYDPKEGRYYDRGRDMYLEREDGPFS